MGTTQKIYYGNTLVPKNYLGSSPIVSRSNSGDFEIEYLVVAGGGGGGSKFNLPGGGGGAGRAVSGSSITKAGETYDATIGNGGSKGSTFSQGSPGGNGGNSTFIGDSITIRMNGGGGGGGGSSNPAAGRDGGSGGGASADDNSGNLSAPGGTATNGGLVSDLSGIGSDGGDNILGDPRAKNGGGANLTWFDGITYAKNGLIGPAPSEPGSGGRGSSAFQTAGRAGIVKVRYKGTPRATGGTITQDGGYTYHTFTSNGTFTVTG